MSEKITIEINGNETVEMRKGAKMTFLAKKPTPLNSTVISLIAAYVSSLSLREKII